MNYKVTILTRHTKEISFDTRKPGALVKAVNDAHPDLHITEEFDGFCVDKFGLQYAFNCSETGYNRNVFDALSKRDISAFTIDLHREKFL